MKVTNNKKVGFTLVELIVVITIMMVATMIGVVSFQAANKKSRDGRRMADLEKIRIALEMYRQDNAIYPPIKDNLVTKYLQAMPVGPKGVTDVYTYTRTVGSSYTYTLDATVEDVGSTNCPSCGGMVYRVTNP